MNCLDAALRFNQICPKGSAVEVLLSSGKWLRTKTAGPAFVWSGLALVELEGNKGPFQVEHVRPADEPVAATASASAPSTARAGRKLRNWRYVQYVRHLVLAITGANGVTARHEA